MRHVCGARAAEKAAAAAAVAAAAERRRLAAADAERERDAAERERERDAEARAQPRLPSSDKRAARRQAVKEATRVRLARPDPRDADGGVNFEVFTPGPQPPLNKKRRAS